MASCGLVNYPKEHALITNNIYLEQCYQLKITTLIEAAAKLASK